VRILTNLINQFKQFWGQTTGRARIGIVATAIVCAVTIVGVGIWSSRPQYVPIASGLAPAEAAEIVSKLDADRIPNKLNFSGSAVLVPKTQWNRARLLLGDVVGISSGAVEEFDDSLFSDPSLNQFKMVRHQEATRARRIARKSSVENATVHISKADPSPFVRDARPTTASVVLELRKGATFTREQAATVVALMANSVEGLETDQVTVVDTSGRLVSSDPSGLTPGMSAQYEYRRKVEADLATKAEGMLAEMLGSGRAIVRVTADIDFTESTREEITYDPDAKVKVKETIESTSRSDTRSSASGVAGTSSNVGNLAAGGQGKPYLEKTENIETEYDNGETKDTVIEAPGQVKRLTVAAMVDLSPAGEGDTASAPAVTQEQIEAILKQAVGFDENRKDEIEVLVTKLAGVDLAGPVAAPGYFGWDSINRLLRNVSLGLASIVALILGLLIVRRMRPVVDPSAASQGFSVERARQIAELSERALANPEALSKIIQVWLNEARQEGGEEQGSERAERDSEQGLGNDAPPAEGRRDAAAA